MALKPVLERTPLFFSAIYAANPSLSRFGGSIPIPTPTAISLAGPNTGGINSRRERRDRKEMGLNDD